MPVRKVISSYDDDDIDGNDSDDDDIDDNYIDDDIDSDSDKEPGAWHSCSDARAWASTSGSTPLGVPVDNL